MYIYTYIYIYIYILMSAPYIHIYMDTSRYAFVWVSKSNRE